MACPPLAIYEQVSGALAGTAPTFLGRKHLPQQDAPRRYVWVFAGEESAGAARVGGNAKSLHNDAWSVDVHCWGASFEESYRLRQALVTVLRREVKGSNYRLGRTVIISGEQYTACGDVMVVALTLITPLAASRIEELVDEVRPTVVAKVAEFDSGHVEAFGTSPPPLHVSGTPLGAPRVRVAIDREGALGAATFRYSVDGGASWEAVFVPTAESCALAATGLVAHFGPGLYRADNVYVFSDRSPVRGDGLLEPFEE